MILRAWRAILKLAHDQPASTNGRRLDDVLWRSLFQFARRKGICLHDYFDEKSRQTLDANALIGQAEVNALASGLAIEARQAALPN